MSFPRKRESNHSKIWIPACAGMTERISSILCRLAVAKMIFISNFSCIIGGLTYSSILVILNCRVKFSLPFPRKRESRDPGFRGDDNTRGGDDYSNMRRFIFIFCFCLSLVSSPAFAKLPRKGFYTGPYVMLAGGAMEFDWDKNETTGIEEGSPWGLMLGLVFGWNVYDWLVPEALFRFSTDNNYGKPEYM